MKKLTLLFGMFSLLTCIPVFVHAQTDDEKKAANIKKLELALENAEKKLEVAERQVASADSLINVGTTMVTDAKSELKIIEGERKKLDKDYATNRKPLEKLSVSKDKEEATQAKTELKALDTQYKADSKALDLRGKDATKKLTTGESYITKGKANKSKATENLKTSQYAVEVARMNYDEATAPAVEEEKKKKK